MILRTYLKVWFLSDLAEDKPPERSIFFPVRWCPVATTVVRVRYGCLMHSSATGSRAEAGPGRKTTPKWGIKPPLKPPRVVVCPLLWGIKPPLLGDKTTPLGGYNHPLWGIKPPPLVKTTPFGGIKPPQGGFMPPKHKMTQHGKTKQNNLNQRNLKSALCETILIWLDSMISTHLQTPP